MSWWKDAYDIGKGSPWWVLAGIYVCFYVTLWWVPNAYTGNGLVWVWIIGLWSPAVLLVIGFFGFINWLVRRAHKKPPEKDFVVTPMEGITTTYWNCAVQQDGSFVLFLVGKCAVKNKTDSNMLLVKARLIKPKVDGLFFNEMINPRGIASNDTAPVSIHLAVKLKSDYPKGTMSAVVGITNDDSHEERVNFQFYDSTWNTKTCRER